MGIMLSNALDDVVNFPSDVHLFWTQELALGAMRFDGVFAFCHLRSWFEKILAWRGNATAARRACLPTL
jgi:hypothetical protein